MVRWTRWQAISAVIGTVIALVGGAFFLVDRFSSANATSPSAAGADTRPTPRPTCANGAICLWSERGFGGKSWVWVPGVSENGLLPDYLRDHVGSFDAQGTACFIDTESKERRPVKITDWSEKYLDKGRFGRIMDSVDVRC